MLTTVWLVMLAEMQESISWFLDFSLRKLIYVLLLNLVSPVEKKILGFLFYHLVCIRTLFYCFLLILFPQRSRSVIIQILDHLLCPTDAYEYRFPHPYFFFLLRPGKLYLNSVFNFDNYVIYVNSTLSTYSYLKGISYCGLSVI